jgi:DNA-binding LytR/AlgR family response regulator
MRKIRVLIVDDEPGSHKILENYIFRKTELELTGVAFNAIEAGLFLSAHSVDVIFLDITMPEIDGFAFIKMLKKPPFIIFTTAHSQYALESYEYNAVDYLKKPIPFDRFTRAINKLLLMMDKGASSEPVKNDIRLKVGGCMTSVPLNQILYVQSMGNYVKIFMENKFLITQVTTAELEDNLPKLSFLRIHKSFIINRSKIEEISGDELRIGGNRLPIGKTFKKYVKELTDLS